MVVPLQRLRFYLYHCTHSNRVLSDNSASEVIEKHHCRSFGAYMGAYGTISSLPKPYQRVYPAKMHSFLSWQAHYCYQLLKKFPVGCILGAIRDAVDVVKMRSFNFAYFAVPMHCSFGGSRLHYVHLAAVRLEYYLCY